MGRFYERNKAAPIVIHSCHNSKHKYEVQKSPLNTLHNNYQIQIKYYVNQIKHLVFQQFCLAQSKFHIAQQLNN